MTFREYQNLKGRSRLLEHLENLQTEKNFFWQIGHDADVNKFYNDLGKFLFDLESKDIPYITIFNTDLKNPFDGLERLNEIWIKNMEILGDLEISKLTDKERMISFIRKFIVAIKIEKTPFTFLDLENALYSTLNMFIKIYYKEYYVEKSKNVFISRFKAFLFKTIYWFNNYLHEKISATNTKLMPKLFYYDEIKTEQILFFYFLNLLGYRILIIDTNGERTVRDVHISGMRINCVDYDYKSPKRDLDKIKIKIENVNTVALRASEEIGEQLYNTETGVFKPKQLANFNLNPILLNTIFDEVPKILYQEIRYREGFKVIKDVVYSPQLFLKIDGVPEKSVNENKKILNAFYNKDCKEWIIFDLPFLDFEEIGACVTNREKSFSELYSHYDKKIAKRLQNACEKVLDANNNFWDKNNAFLHSQNAPNAQNAFKMTGIIASALKYVLQNNVFSFMFKKIDLPFQSPKVMVNDIMIDKINASDNNKLIGTTFLLFCYFMGMDIIVFSSACDTFFENYLNRNMFNKLTLREVYNYTQSRLLYDEILNDFNSVTFEFETDVTNENNGNTSFWERLSDFLTNR